MIYRIAEGQTVNNPVWEDGSTIEIANGGKVTGVVTGHNLRVVVANTDAVFAGVTSFANATFVDSEVWATNFGAISNLGLSPSNSPITVTFKGLNVTTRYRYPSDTNRTNNIDALKLMAQFASGSRGLKINYNGAFYVNLAITQPSGSPNKVYLGNAIIIDDAENIELCGGGTLLHTVTFRNCQNVHVHDLHWVGYHTPHVFPMTVVGPGYISSTNWYVIREGYGPAQYDIGEGEGHDGHLIQSNESIFKPDEVCGLASEGVKFSRKSEEAGRGTSSGFIVEDCSFEMLQDAIAFGGTSRTNLCKDAVIRRCSFTYQYYQALGLHGGDILVEDCTGDYMLQAIDMSTCCHNMTVRNSTFLRNATGPKQENSIAFVDMSYGNVLDGVTYGITSDFGTNSSCYLFLFGVGKEDCVVHVMNSRFVAEKKVRGYARCNRLLIENTEFVIGGEKSSLVTEHDLYDFIANSWNAVSPSRAMPRTDVVLKNVTLESKATIPSGSLYPGGVTPCLTFISLFSSENGKPDNFRVHCENFRVRNIHILNGIAHNCEVFEAKDCDFDVEYIQSFYTRFEGYTSTDSGNIRNCTDIRLELSGTVDSINYIDNSGEITSSDTYVINNNRAAGRYAQSEHLSELVLNDVTSIAAGAFMNCKNLRSIYVNGETATTISQKAFDGLPYRGTLYYRGSIDESAWKAALPEGWSIVRNWTRVNWKSDIPPIDVELRNDYGLTPDQMNFILRFSVDGYHPQHFDCVCMQGECKNCEVIGNKVRCYIAAHHFQPGWLRMEYISIVPNEDGGFAYYTGAQKTVTPVLLNIVELVLGPGDTPKDLGVGISMDIRSALSMQQSMQREIESLQGRLGDVESKMSDESELAEIVSDLGATLNGKQDTLVSGTNIKTVNNNSLLGQGNVNLSADDIQLDGASLKTQSQNVDEALEELFDSVDSKADKATTYTKSEVDTALIGKQATLVSGTNIKTINSQSLLGSGNIDIQGGGDLSNYYTKSETNSLLADKQDALVSGTNIKTVNGESLLGSSDIDADDVIMGKIDGTSFYKVTGYSGLNATPTFSGTAEVGNENKIYVDILSNRAYRWTNSIVSLGESKYKLLSEELDVVTDNEINSLLPLSTKKAISAKVLRDNFYTETEVNAAFANYCPIIEDTRSSAVAAITGVAPFDTLVDKQRIVVKLKYKTSANATLTLTGLTNALPIYARCSTNNNSDIAPIYVNGFVASSYMELIYDATNSRWICTNYDRVMTYEALTQSRIDGSSTAQCVITGKLLRDNFYTKTEIDTAIGAKADKVQEVEVTGATPTQTLAPNTFYKFTGQVTSLTLTLGTPISGVTNIYGFSFTAGAANPTITWPQGCKLDGEPTLGAGDYFEATIQDGYVLYKIWKASTT